MHRLAKLSLRNRAVVALVSIAILVGGVFSMTSLKQELIPSLELPMALVTATNPGVTSSLMEQQLAEPLESAIQSVPGVESIQTTSVDSAIFAIVEFRYGTNMDTSNQKLSTAIARIARQLPSGVDTNVMTGSMDDFPIIQLAVSAAVDTSAADLSHLVDDVIVPKLSRLENVRSVAAAGLAQPQIIITPRAADLARTGLAMTDITAVLNDYGLALPAGQVGDGDQTLSVQAGQAIGSAEELGRLPIGLIPASAAQPSATLIRLADVADVVSTTAAATSHSRLNGAEAVSVSVTKTPAGNTVDVSNAVKQALDELADSLEGADLETAVVFDQAPFIERSIRGLSEEGLIGLGFAVIVILVFLFSVRSTLVSAVSIPLSLLMAFIAMRATGESLNILTLGAMTIAIGRVVDDSIVVIENIKRHLSYGEAKRDAIITAVREVGGAVASSTICTVAVFTPLAFTGGMVGELFRPFGLTVALALAASLLVALTIVPVLAYWFVPSPVSVDAADQAWQRQQAEAKERRGFWQRLYLPTLRAALRHRVVTLVVAVLLLGGTVALVPTLETNFLGDMGQDNLSVTQTFAAGASLDQQDRQARQTEAALAKVDGVETVLTQVGGGGLMGISLSAEPQATFSLTLDEGADPATVETAVRQAAQAAAGQAVTDTAVNAGQSAMMGSTTVDLIVRADDQQVLAEAAAQVEQVARDTPGSVEVANDLAADQPIVQITVDKDKARALGLSETAVEGLVRSLTVPSQIGSLTVGLNQVPVLVALGPGAATVEELSDLPLLATANGSLKLSDVAAVEVVRSPVSLTRVDSQRSATIAVTPQTQDLGSLSSALTEAVDGLDLPAGATVEVGGAAAQMNDAFSDLGLALVIAIIIVFIVMVATFGSLLQPFILLVSIPFAATGALLALIVSGTPLGVPSIIGLLMLVGIVVSNAIVLIDLINQYRSRGRDLDQAIEEGARKRLRPILMTAAATIFALLPMAFGLTGGGGSFLSQPLALVVIGGLVSSTLLTLVVVPVLYSFEARFHDHRQARHQARLEARRQERAQQRAERLAAAEPTDVVPVAAPSVEDGSFTAAAPATEPLTGDSITVVPPVVTGPTVDAAGPTADPAETGPAQTD
ncbi:MAG: efflux RND transporter permease subunit [Propionibacteriaceae bacterium]|jgi:HAE1 family hydrophobic/amphiphilic exporter-1|nr:efflux RND transporter permease subunit [Propionibacteriaceae bacterium]